MRIAEKLPTFFGRMITSLWVIGYGVTFVSAISTLWGWRFIGWGSCLVLVAFVVDDRKAIAMALANGSRKADRLFALYLLGIMSAALIVNVVFIFFTWLQ